MFFLLREGEMKDCEDDQYVACLTKPTAVVPCLLTTKTERAQHQFDGNVGTSSYLFAVGGCWILFYSMT